jgi:ppGpp synthetase/RelA/SpoT-type nucleotidyltranferase
MDSYIKKLIKNYEKKKPLYEDFCLSINRLLCNILDNKKYKYQIYYRIKSLARLEEKITRKKKLKKIYKKLSDIDDLAGIRIVFYLESEKEKFLKDLQKEMPSIIAEENLEKKNGYKAKHAIITLDKKRLALSEYKKFKNLKCEIQLVSIFNHAWAELEHDWLYKDFYKFKERNPEGYIFIKKQMENIFKNYVRKLTSRLEKVAKQIPSAKKHRDIL